MASSRARPMVISIFILMMGNCEMVTAQSVSQMPGARTTHTINTSALPCANITEFVVAFSQKVLYSKPIGILGVMFADIEVRKHTEPWLQQQFGPLGLKFPSWAPKNPCFKIRPIILDLPSDANVWDQGALWNAISASTGTNGVHKCVTFVSKCSSSECELKVASFLAVKKVPHYAYSTAPNLTDKVRYPYTFRFLTSDNTMSQIVMHYVNTFKFRTATVIYHMKEFGLGIFNGFMILAQASMFAQRVFSFTLPTLPGRSVDELCKDIAKRAKWMPTRLIIMFVQGETDVLLTNLRNEQLWMPHYQIVGTNNYFGSQLQNSIYIHQLATTPIHFTYLASEATVVNDAANSVRMVIFVSLNMALSGQTGFLAAQLPRYSMDTWNPDLPSFNSSLVNFSWLKTFGPGGDLESVFAAAWPLFSLFYAINDVMNLMPANEITGTHIRDATRNNNFPSFGLEKQQFDSNQDLITKWGMFQTCTRPGAVLGNLSLAKRNNCTGGFPAGLQYGPYFIAPFTLGRAGQYQMYPGNVVRWGTGLKSNSAPPELTECQAGQFITGTGSCEMCKEGYVSSTFNAAACGACSAGTFAEANRTMCSDCPPGRGSSESGSTACMRCPPGFFGSGSSNCQQCEPGRYAGAHESTECKECEQVLNGSSSIRASTRPEDCICPQGLYRQIDNGTCASCPTMMTCKMGSAIDNFFAMKQRGFPADDPQMYPLLQQLYWSSEQKPLSVFLCNSRVACPGGRPGSCGPHTKGQSCGECEAGYWRNEQGCHKCTSIVFTAIVFPVLPVFLTPPVICGLYFLFRDMPDKWESWQNLLAALLLIVFSHYQTIGIIGAANVEWPSRSDKVLDAWAWTNDFLSLFNVGCVGISGFTGAYLVQILAPIAICIMCICTYFLAKTVAACCLRGMMMDKDRLVNVFMSLIYTFFAAIASATMLIGKFKKSPNGELALATDASVLKKNGEWQSLLIVGIVAISVECVAVITLFIYVIRIAPSRFRDESFQKRWKFLFIKYRPDVYWWGVPYLLRGVLINLALVIMVKGARQLLWIYFTMMAYCCSVIAFHPWRNLPTNALDILGAIAVASSAVVGTWFATERGLTKDVEYVTIVLKFGAALAFAISFSVLIAPKALNTKVAMLRRKSTGLEMKELSHVRMACQIITNLDQSSAEDFVFDFLGQHDRLSLTKAADCILLEFRVYRSTRRICRDDWQGRGGSDEVVKDFEVISVRSSRSSSKCDENSVNDNGRAHQTAALEFVIDSSPAVDKESRINQGVESAIEYIEEENLQRTPMQHASIDAMEQIDSVDWPYESTPKACGWACAYPWSPKVPATITTPRNQIPSLWHVTPLSIVSPSGISAKASSALSPTTRTPRARTPPTPPQD